MYDSIISNAYFSVLKRLLEMLIANVPAMRCLIVHLVNLNKLYKKGEIWIRFQRNTFQMKTTIHFAV